MHRPEERSELEPPVAELVLQKHRQLWTAQLVESLEKARVAAPKHCQARQPEALVEVTIAEKYLDESPWLAVSRVARPRLPFYR